MNVGRDTASLAAVPFLVIATTCLPATTGGTHAPGSALSGQVQERKPTTSQTAPAPQGAKADQRSEQESPLVAQAAASDDPVVRQLIENLSDKDWRTRTKAAEGLGKMGRRSAAVDAVPEFERLLTGDLQAALGDKGFAHEEHDAALTALKQLAPERVRPALLSAAKSRNGDVKRWAIDQLTKPGDEK